MTSMLDPEAHLLVILNRGSGNGEADETAATIRRSLSEAGRSFELRLVEHPGRLGEAAAQSVEKARALGGAVVVAGGDGTIGAVAQEALRAGCPFGVLPQGTFNYFSRVWGISTDTLDAIHQLLSAHVRPVQVGLVNDRVFLVNASLGLYAELLEEREGFKRQLGRSRTVAFVAALSTLLREHGVLRLRVQVGADARPLATSSLFVANNRLQLEQVGIPQAPAVEEGRLVGIQVATSDSRRLLQLMLEAVMGRLGAADEVESFAFERMRVLPRRTGEGGRVKVAMDGEIHRLKAPLDLRVAPERLKLLVPAEPRWSP